MRTEHAMVGLHGAAVVLALVAALVWPRAGEAAVMMPLGRTDLGAVLRWAEKEDAQLIEIDPASGRVIVRFSSQSSLFSALGAGILPVAARAPGCQPVGKR